MAKFNGHMFCSICAQLAATASDWDENRDKVMPPAERTDITNGLTTIAEHCEEAGLLNSASYIKDCLDALNTQVAAGNEVYYSHIQEAFGNLQPMIKSEMKRVEYLRVDKAEYYGTFSRFEPFVTDIYPKLIYDIVEAGNCLALDRTTACVFHLMRVVEFGVQRLGDKLGVRLVNETVWQAILNQVDAKIRAMPDKPAAKKRQKEKYAETAGHLYNVKVAWRNPVMHPKRTYTAEEAEHLFMTVRMFISNLIRLLRPQTVEKVIAERKRLVDQYNRIHGLLGSSPTTNKTA